MRLYHGSNVRIEQIDLRLSKDHKDFGRGFYLTKDYSRAVGMAQRTTAIEGFGSPTISPFIYNPGRVTDPLNVKTFSSRTAEWALFVLENRNKNQQFEHPYDVVIGPVADSSVDQVLMAYRQKYGMEYRDPEHLRELATLLRFPGPDYIQYCFSTQKAINQLINDR